MKTYIIHSSEGNRMWHADDRKHAFEQHRESFPDEPILGWYECVHPEDCACGN